MNRNDVLKMLEARKIGKIKLPQAFSKPPPLALAGKDLSNADLSGLDLQCANLFRANLAGANLCGTALSRANLYEANLTGCKFDDKTNLSSANLYGCKIDNATGFSKSCCKKANLKGASLTGAVTALELKNPKYFDEANIAGVVL